MFRLLPMALALFLGACATDVLPYAPSVPCASGEDCSEGAACVDDECVLVGDDVGVPDTSNPDPNPSPNPEPEAPAIGDPCDNGDDCPSGYCIEASDGGGQRLCTDFCDPTNPTTCPGGFVCASVANSGADRIFLCFPESDFLCSPCQNDNDCGGLSDVCLSLSDGQFCGRACQLEACPDGFDCVDGDGGPQCRPSEGFCTGCDDPQGLTGRPCGTCDEGVWQCRGGGALVCAGDPGEGRLNACGGCGALDSAPGGACGTCSTGQRVCAGSDRVECAGDQGDAAFNACGGCTTLSNPPETACGRCGLDRYTCRGEDATECSGDTAINACGGCQRLSNAPGAGCGVCGDGRYVCNGQERTTCDDPPPPAETCNRLDDDCDGAIDDNISGGCTRPVHRSFKDSTGEHFYTTSRSEAACCGFRVEFFDYYALYRNPATGLAPFYRCIKANGKHFYTTSANCEILGAGARESTMGYISTRSAPGTVRLYRAYNAINGDHFYTTSAAEFNNALRNGYSGEPEAGWVFPP